VVAAVAGRPIYVHLDCDVLEPGLVPTDFQVAGGLSLQSLHSIFCALAKELVLGFEIAEFQHAWAAGMEPASADDLVEAVVPLLKAVAQQHSGV
jgi:arginase/N-omega-hydroxy-L-arginine amidinohydrolase